MDDLINYLDSKKSMLSLSLPSPFQKLIINLTFLATGFTRLKWFILIYYIIHQLISQTE